MPIRLLDLVALGATLLMVQSWNDGNPTHKWVLFCAVLATNLLGFFRGISAK